MALAPGFIGEFRKGDRVQFAVDNSPSGGSTWDAAFYDVIDNHSKVALLSDQALIADTDSEPFIEWVDFQLADDFDSDGARLQTWTEGRGYSIRVKSAAGLPPTDASSFLVNFQVANNKNQAFLGVVEKGKTLYFLHREENRAAMFYDVIDPLDGNLVFTDVAMSVVSVPGGDRFFSGSIESEGTDDLAVGRTYWVRVKDAAGTDPDLDAIYSFTVLPRMEAQLARLLAYAGENVAMDSFTYDQAGNILGLRVRAFSNATDAANATDGVTDPEPGEIASLVITQEHNVPRNVRTFHRSVLEFISASFPEEG